MSKDYIPYPKLLSFKWFKMHLKREIVYGLVGIGAVFVIFLMVLIDYSGLL